MTVYLLFYFVFVDMPLITVLLLTSISSIHGVGNTFGVDAVRGHVDLNLHDNYKVQFLASPLGLVSDLLTLRKYANDLSTSLQLAMTQFVSSKLSTPSQQSIIEACMFNSDVSNSDKAECVKIGQVNFIQNRIIKYSDFLRNLDTAIQLRLVKIESMVPQTLWLSIQNTLSLSLNTGVINTFNLTNANNPGNNIVVTNQAPPNGDISEEQITDPPTTAPPSEHSDLTTSDETSGREDEHANIFTAPASNGNLHIIIIPFSQSSLNKYTLTDDQYFDSSFTARLVLQGFEISLAFKDNTILIETSSYLFKSPTTDFLVLYNNNRTFSAQAQRNWASSLTSLESFIKAPEFQTFKSTKIILQSILNKLSSQIEAFQSFNTLDKGYSNEMLDIILANLAELLTFATPELQQIHSVLIPLCTALQEPWIHMKSNPHILGIHPQLEFNSLGYVPASIITNQAFTVKELNQRFIAESFPPGVSALWTQDGLSYISPVELSISSMEQITKDHEPQLHLQTVTLSASPRYIEDPNILTCLSSIMAGNNKSVIEHCKFSMSTPFTNTWHITDNNLQFSIQKEISLSAVCHCLDSFTWLDIKLLGVGHFLIPTYCVIFDKDAGSSPREIISQIHAHNESPCSEADITENITYENTFTSHSDLAKFIISNHHIDSININFSVERHQVADSGD